MSNYLNAFEIAKQETTSFALSSAKLHVASGQDLIRYTQGRITQDVSKLEDGMSNDFMLLDPRGTLLSIGIVSKLEQELIFFSFTPEDKSFEQSFLQFRVADDVKLENLDDNLTIRIIVGPDISKLDDSLKDPLGAKKSLANTQFIELGSSTAYLIPTSFLNLEACYLVSDSSEVQSVNSILDKAGQVFSEEDFEYIRVLAKIPSPTQELKHKCIATDYNYHKYISFDKGCYTGQEVVEMSTARGRPNKRLELFEVETQNPISVDGQVCLADSGKKVGDVSSSVFLAEKGIAYCLAFIKNSIDQDAPFLINGIRCNSVA